MNTFYLKSLCLSAIPLLLLLVVTKALPDSDESNASGMDGVCDSQKHQCPDKIKSCTSWSDLFKENKTFQLYDHLNTKRPYPEINNSFDVPEGCSLVQIHYVGRHASRYHNSEDKVDEIIKQIDGIFAEVNTSESKNALDESIQKLKEETEESAGKITQLGRKELIGITTRMMKGGLTLEKLSQSESVATMTANTDRTEESLNIVLDRIKEKSGHKTLEAIKENYTTSTGNNILNSHKNSSFFKESRKKSKEAFKLKEDEILKNNKDLPGDFINLNPNNMTLKNKYQVISALYHLCQMDSNRLKKNQHGFCKLIHNDSEESVSIIKILGALENMKHWYKTGIPVNNPMTYTIAGPLFEKMVELLDQAATKPNDVPILRIWFTHHLEMLALTLLMGYLGETPKEKYWDTDLIAPMAANIQLRIYQCGDTPKVRVLHNERPICMSNCSSDLCPWSNLSGYFKQQIKTNKPDRNDAYVSDRNWKAISILGSIAAFFIFLKGYSWIDNNTIP